MPKIENNSWIRKNTSRTIFIFVHGILSDSDGCWRNKKAKTYWPEMVANDPQFQNPSIFVAGYTADVMAGLYDVRSAADDILTVLRSPNTPQSPLDKDRIIFVCHSQGGIIVRQLLCSSFEEFKEKHVGIVFCGSPSWGSIYGTFFAPFTFLLRFRQGSALSFGASTLRNLDRDFLDLLEKKRIPQLDGLCLVETRGRFFGIPIPKIVSTASASRYFPWRSIAKTTHVSLVKPNSITHGSHIQLRDFARNNGFLTQDAFKVSLAALLSSMEIVLQIFKSGRIETDEKKSEALVDVSKKTRKVLENVDRLDRFDGINIERIINADFSANGSWAFDNLSREDFVQIQHSLINLLNHL